MIITNRKMICGVEKSKFVAEKTNIKQFKMSLSAHDLRLEAALKRKAVLSELFPNTQNYTTQEVHPEFPDAWVLASEVPNLDSSEVPVVSDPVVSVPVVSAPSVDDLLIANIVIHEVPPITDIADEVLEIIYKSCDTLTQFQIIKDLYDQDEEGELKDMVNELGMTKGAKYVQDVFTIKEKTNVRIFKDEEGKLFYLSRSPNPIKTLVTSRSMIQQLGATRLDFE
jgi:hypothetical protein